MPPGFRYSPFVASAYMNIPVPLSWKALPSPQARLNWAEIPFGTVFGVLLRFMAVKAGFVTESNSIAS